MVVPDSLHRRFPPGINGSARTGNERLALERYPFVQNVVTDLPGKPLFIVEEMTPRMINHVRFLAVRHRDVGVLIKMIVQRTCSSLLGPRDNEVQTLDFFSF